MLISETIASIVHGGMDKKSVTAYVRELAIEKLREEDQAHFIEVVETELMGLREG